MLSNWLREALKHSDMSKAELARRLSVRLQRSFDRSIVQKMAAGTRKVAADEMLAIAEITGFRTNSAAETTIAGFGKNGDDVLEKHQVWTVMIIGEVAAGVWHEAAADAFEPESYTVPVDPRFRKEDQFLLRVRGSSINRRAPSGSLVRCVRAYAISELYSGREPRDGDWVICQRTRNGFAESTVKQCRMTGGKLLLYPDSTDPAHQDPIEIGDFEYDSVEIIAYVMDFIIPATKI